jgi:hypothetical protein
MIISMTACGENKNVTTAPTQTEQPAASNGTQQNNDKKAGKKDYEEFDYLTSEYRDPTYKATINGPNLNSFFEYSSQLWNADRKYFIAFGIYQDYWDGVDRAAIKTVEDIIPNLKDDIIKSSESECYAKIRDVNITSQKKVSINGREANRFEGHFDSDSSDGSISDKYIVGYSLFFKDAPMFLIGVVSSNGQEQEYKDTVTKTIDDMIKTLRDGAIAQ